jgi:hypothetical protein
MGDREEKIIENTNNERRENDRKTNLGRRVKSSLLNLQGEKHQLPTLPQGILSIFTGDGIMDPKNHMDQFIFICDIHLIEHDDVMINVFLQTLIGPAYDWYISLPTQPIGSFNICS